MAANHRSALSGVESICGATPLANPSPSFDAVFGYGGGSYSSALNVQQYADDPKFPQEVLALTGNREGTANEEPPVEPFQDYTQHPVEEQPAATRPVNPLRGSQVVPGGASTKG